MRRLLLRMTLAALCLGALTPAQVRAEPAPEPEPVVQPRLGGYLTESGRRLPLPAYAPYQAPRRPWTAGFATTLSCLAVLGTGVGVLLVGSQATDSLTEQGQGHAMVAGGTLTAVGAAGTALGAV